jgi:hypothetical protein
LRERKTDDGSIEIVLVLVLVLERPFFFPAVMNERGISFWRWFIFIGQIEHRETVEHEHEHEHD